MRNEHFGVSTGQSDIGGGLERYTFEISASFLQHVNPTVLKERLAGQYLLSPRPDAREILDVSVSLAGHSATVTLVIQRGHYVLAKLVRDHETLTFHRDEGFATCECHPGVRHPIVMSSFPDYKEIF